MAKEKQVQIRVHTAFRFTNEKGEVKDFPVGFHNVAESVAAHFFVKHHSDLTDGSVVTDEQLQSRISELEEQVTALTQENAELTEKLAGKTDNGEQSKPADSK